MQLDWLEHLKDITLQYKTPVRGDLLGQMTSFSESDEMNREVRTQRLWKWDLHLGYRQNLPSGASDEQIEAKRIEAARAIARMLYGPIIEELQAARIELVDGGCDYTDPTLQRIEEMLKALELAQP